MHAEELYDSLSWYVIHANPRQEDRAESNLKAWGVDTFFPRIKERRFQPYTGEPTYLIKPLFPRYIFARFRLGAMHHKIRFTRGVHTVVSFGDVPIPVDDEIIKMIESRVDHTGYVKIGEEFEPGDEVLIKGGPLDSFRGVFEREMKGADRVMILLDTVRYQARIVVEREMVQKLASHMKA